MIRVIGKASCLASSKLYRTNERRSSLITSTFSEDSTLMAAGFSESYIRLWNLKGGKLTGIRTDFDSDDINDGSFKSILSSFFTFT